MGKLTDIQIRAWIKSREHFEGRADGLGLYLSFPKSHSAPIWKFRYRFAGKQRIMNMGGYAVVSLAKARETAKELSALVALGHDVAGEKQTRKREAIAKIDSDKAAWTVNRLCDEFFERVILPKWKHSDIVRRRIENDIKPQIGKMRAEDVKPRDIDDLLQVIVKRGAPTIANDVLRWTKRIFNFAIKRHVVETNPASAFDPSDAGGKESSRDRWLSREELIQLFQAMREMLGRFSVENMYAVRLLLLLAVRKEELVSAPWSEFDFDKAVWHLPEERTKTSAAIDIPLPPLALETLQELHRLANGSAYVFPARKMQHRMIPHIDLNTLNAAIAKHIRPKLKGVENFTIHDFRRTARTHLAAMGVDPFIAERCLNHKIKGVEGTQAKIRREDWVHTERTAIMGKLSDMQIRGWIKASERLEQRGDGEGLYLRYRKEDAPPRWLFRYRLAGQARILSIGSYGTLSVADARKTAKEMRARVSLGHDPQGEKKERKLDAVAKIEADRLAVTMGQLADDYFAAQIVGRWKHPNIVRARIENDIKPNIGRLAVTDVKPQHIDAMLQTIVKRGAPTMANDVLRWVKRMLDYAIKRQMVA